MFDGAKEKSVRAIATLILKVQIRTLRVKLAVFL